MSSAGTHTWLVAYDIADPHRLRRVHRVVRRYGLAVQYSAFVVDASDTDLDELLGDLEALIDPARDDIRAYHIPPRCAVWTLGRLHLPAGALLDAPIAGKLLASSHEPADTEGTLICP